MSVQGIGASPRRREDERLLRGQGRFLDDLPATDALHAVFLRSPHAHARLRALDLAAARAMPGVHAVLSVTDATADGLAPLRPYAEANTRTGEPFAFLPQPLLVDGTTRHVGEAVALVVAESAACALDALEAIAADWESLPAVTTIAAARALDAPLLADSVPRNTGLDWRLGDDAAVERAMATAAHVVRRRIINHRVVSNPIESRGALASFDAASGRYTLRVASQSLHLNRDYTARALGVPASQVRFVAQDVGGGFGAKNFAYPEHVLLLWAARRLGRPVKWVASRTETLLSEHPGRDHEADATLALDAGGRFLALAIDGVANIGAYMIAVGGGVQTNQYPHLAGTLYAIPAIALGIAAVNTSTTPIGVTRAPGFAEMNAIMELLIDEAARATGMDRLELRRRNLVLAAAMPWTNVLGGAVDSGDFPAALARARAAADLAGFADRRATSAARGLLRGFGVAAHIKATGGPPDENAEIRFTTAGGVDLIVGTQSIGQGHETSFPQILAERFGIPNATIRLVQGDTDAILKGGGHGSSRSTYMGGTAIWRAADAVLSKARPLAAAQLGCVEAEIDFDSGHFRARGTNRTLALLELATRARAAGTPLDSYVTWTREAMTLPNGVHVAEVEIDPETGRPTLVSYVGVDDYGVVVNPLLVEGQAHGAMAQGAGQALLEYAVYDPASGQMRAATLMDYALPRADDLPSFHLELSPTRCTTNPLGVKGAGEAGAIAAFPAILNAIKDAVGGKLPGAGPATSERIWRAIRCG